MFLLVAKPLVPLLGYGELHPLALWQRDEWFASLRLICYDLYKHKRISQANCVYLANGEDIVEPGGKDMPIAVLDVAYVKRPGMLLPRKC